MLKAKRRFEAKDIDVSNNLIHRVCSFQNYIFI